MQAKQIIPFLDYTSLSDTDSAQNIAEFLKEASGDYGKVAAVCIYPQFVTLAKQALKAKNIFIATVVNFPQGNLTIDKVLTQTKIALQEGADEIDVVCFYQDYLLQGKSPKSSELITELKNICQNKILKVILETGELKKTELIKQASKDAILSGADFLKTSTGKTKQGASLEAARTMLTEIRQSQKKVGLKISGGVRNYQQALEYIELIKKMGLQDLLTPSRFRIGASSLLADLLKNF